MIYTLYYIMKQFVLLSLRLHESFLALRLAFVDRLLPSYSYSSRADTFLKVSGTLYRFGSKLGVRGRVSLFNFSILLRFNPPNSRVIRDYFWIYLEHLLVLYIREWYTLIEAIENKRI